MKYLKGNPDLLFFIFVIYTLFVMSCCVFLNIIPTGVELNVHEFNIKTISVICMLVFGFLTLLLTKILKSNV